MISLINAVFEKILSSLFFKYVSWQSDPLQDREWQCPIFWRPLLQIGLPQKRNRTQSKLNLFDYLACWKNFAGTRLTTSTCQVASLETDTATELKETTRAINSIDKNLEQRFEDFKAKFHKQMVAFEKKVKLELIHHCGLHNWYDDTLLIYNFKHRWKSLRDLSWTWKLFSTGTKE